MSAQAKRSGRPWLVGGLIAIVALLILTLGFMFAGAIPALHLSGAGSIPVGKPVIVSEEQLREYGTANGTVYWAGPIPDRQYELTRSSGGASFIRYLPAGVKAGSTAKYLTVASYPQSQGYQLLEATAASSGITSQQTTSGALVVINPKTPLSTYFSFKNANFQVEVFSPDTDQSTHLVLDGKLVILGVK